MSNLQTYNHFKLNFQNVVHLREGKEFNPRHQSQQGNQLQSLELLCRIS